MSVFIIRRLSRASSWWFVMSLIVFFGVNIVGDPVDMLIRPGGMTQEDIEAFDRASSGSIGRSTSSTGTSWTNALKGDLGNSFVFAEPALKLILQRMPATLELALAAMVIAVVIGVPLGVYAGLKPESKVSKVIMAGSILGFSLPTFWVGLMFIMIFAVMLGWLPSPRGAVTPPTLFGIQVSFLTWDGLTAPVPARAESRAVQDVAGDPARPRRYPGGALQDYVKFARAKGLSEPPGGAGARDEEHHDPGGDRARSRARRRHRVRRRDRDRVRLAGDGQAAHRLDPAPRQARWWWPI